MIIMELKKVEEGVIPIYENETKQSCRVPWTGIRHVSFIWLITESWGIYSECIHRQKAPLCKGSCHRRWLRDTPEGRYNKIKELRSNSPYSNQKEAVTEGRYNKIKELRSNSP